MSIPDSSQGQALAAPVVDAERIGSLDVLRGVAILGILVMNIYAFAMPFPAYANPLLMGGTEWHNMATWYFTHVFFDQKFLSIFAMLFGAGIILMTGRAEAKGARFGRIFYRRQLWLVLIGALHAYFLWMGDILFMYAMAGMLAFLFRHRKSRTLIVIACMLLPVTLLLNFTMSGQMQVLQAKVAEIEMQIEAGRELSDDQEETLAEWEGWAAFMAPDEQSIAEDLEQHRGGYAGITVARIPEVMAMQFFGFLIFGLWRVLALMLFGMALLKTGVLAAERSADYYRKMMVICYGLGLPLTVYSAIDLRAHDFVAMYTFGAGGVPNYIGSIVVALGHIALVMLLLKTGFLQGLLQRFAAVGRMALTNYLMHSLVLTTVFYGYGLGLYGEISRFAQMGFVVAIIAAQLLLSPWWLHHFRFGPMEWLWRSLTYWQRQPMRTRDQA